MPIREYQCTDCRVKVEVLDLARATPDDSDAVLSTIVPTACKCGGDWEEIFTSISFRLKGPGFHRNDYGPPADFKFATEGRIRMRQEIRDARDSGEIPKGQNPFNTHLRSGNQLLQWTNGMGRDPSKTIGDAMKANHTKDSARRRPRREARRCV